MTCDEHPAPIITVIYGPTGSGNTHRAIAECGENPFYMRRGRRPPTKLWDGYNCEAYVIIDEADMGYVPVSDLLSLLDKFPRTVRSNGKNLDFCATHIWLTATVHPGSWMRRTGLESRAGQCVCFLPSTFICLGPGPGRP